jgi:hypothetical protein
MGSIDKNGLENGLKPQETVDISVVLSPYDITSVRGL